MEQKKVILVDSSDRDLGAMDKLEAHRLGKLHRAFSVFIFNQKGEMLLQQRAENKYHSGGLWSNACCSHPQPGESNQQAAENRLSEEMGFKISLRKIFDFVYRAEFENGLIEHEFDHVFAGFYDGEIKPDKTEVKDFCFSGMDEIRRGLSLSPGRYSEWFRIAFPAIEKWHEQYFSSNWS